VGEFHDSHHIVRFTVQHVAAECARVLGVKEETSLILF
jgi:hypothetical protein